jgi:hypothetical protein
MGDTTRRKLAAIASVVGAPTALASRPLGAQLNEAFAFRGVDITKFQPVVFL